MTDWAALVRRLAADPDGGALVIDVPAGDPTRRFMEMATEARRLGFVAVLVDETTQHIPGMCLQRHMFVMARAPPGD